MEYPQGTRFLNYFYSKDGARWIIRRIVVLPDGTKVLPRHPYKHYAHFKYEEEIKAYVNRLNHKLEHVAKARKAVEVKTSFIPVKYLEDFKERLLTEIPNAKDARYINNQLHNHFLNFFVNEMTLHDPITWLENQTRWALYLLETELSAKSIRQIVQVSNRFMEFLHQKNPREIPFIRFKPISKARYNEYEAKRKLQDDDFHKGLFIIEKDWKKICEKSEGEILPFLQLMYNYGLRKAESLGLFPEDVRTGYLNLERQLKSNPVSGPIYGPLKNRFQRKTPHWFCKPDQCYEWIEESIKHRIHPDTLGVKWNSLMSKLKLDYELHDLRRTFVTRALEEYKPLQVQLAVGHANINTTMKYIRDNRELEDAIFKPRKVK